MTAPPVHNWSSALATGSDAADVTALSAAPPSAGTESRLRRAVTTPFVKLSASAENEPPYRPSRIAFWSASVLCPGVFTGVKPAWAAAPATPTNNAATAATAFGVRIDFSDDRTRPQAVLLPIEVL